MFSLVTFYMLSLMNLVDEIMFCSYLVLGGIEFLSRFLLEVKGRLPHVLRIAGTSQAPDNERLPMIHSHVRTW
jgi:hypothetical protein